MVGGFSRVRKIRRRLVLARYGLFFVAGTLFGIGLLLYAQVRVAEYVRDEVYAMFFLWRALGDATYFLHGTETQIALTLSNLPGESLLHSKRLGITLIAIGIATAATVPLLRRRSRRLR